jgi:hypothetical protein
MALATGYGIRSDPDVRRRLKLVAGTTSVRPSLYLMVTGAGLVALKAWPPFAVRGLRQGFYVPDTPESGLPTDPRHIRNERDDANHGQKLQDEHEPPDALAQRVIAIPGH